MKRLDNRYIPRLVAGLLVIAALSAGMYLAVSPPEQAPIVEFTMINGQRTSTADLRGKVVLINFWATTCPTCAKEMPQIVETYNKFQSRGFETIAIAMRYYPPNYVLKFAESRGLPFKIVLDVTGEIAKRFGNVELTPTTFILDRRGRIVKRYIGGPNFGDLHRLLEEKLAEPGPLGPLVATPAPVAVRSAVVRHQPTPASCACLSA